MDNQFGLETGNGKPGFWNPRKITLCNFRLLMQRAIFDLENSLKPWVSVLMLVENQRLTISNCWEKRKKLKLKLKLKYEVNLRFETRKPNRPNDKNVENLNTQEYWFSGVINLDWLDTTTYKAILQMDVTTGSKTTVIMEFGTLT